MRIKSVLCIVVFGYCLFLNAICFAWSNWKTLKTESFIVFYKQEYKDTALEFLTTMEYYKPGIEKIIGNTRTKLPVVIEDVGTISNGFADPINKRILIYKYIPSYTALGFTENWMALVGVHEYTHILHLTNSNGMPEVLSLLFGNVFCPNIYSPGWIVEGITVYNESNISSFSGRLNDGRFDAYIGARVKDENFPSIIEATNSPLSFPSYTGIYLYGGEFFRYLAEKYGEKRFSYFFNNYGGNMLAYFSPFLPFIGLDRACEGTYGKSFPKLWKEWEKYEIEKHKDFSIDGERLTFNGWEVDNTLVYKNKLYYRRRYTKKTGSFKYFSFNEIVEKSLITGKERVIISVPSLFTAPFKIKHDKIYYSIADSKKGYSNVSILGYGIYSQLYQVDINSGNNKKILECNLRAFDIIDKDTILFSEDKDDEFGSIIYKFDSRLGKKEKIFSSNYLISEIEYKDTKNVYLSAREDWENFSICKLNLETKEIIPLIKTPYFEGNLNIQGDRLFYSANYNNQYSIYCYDIAGRNNYKLTHGKGFATYPAYNEESNRLYFVGITSDGFDIFVKDAIFADYTTSKYTFTTPPEKDKNNYKIKEGGYFDNIKTIIPKVWFPISSSDKEESYVGALVTGQTALGDFYYSGSIVYNTNQSRVDTVINLNSYFFSPFVTYITYDSIGDKSLKTGINYPVLYRLSSGLSLVMPGFAYKEFNDFKRKEIIPSLAMNWNYTRTRIGTMISLPYEPETTYTGEKRIATYISASLEQYIPGGEIDLDLMFIDDTLNPDKTFPVIRGYSEEINSNKGLQYSIDISKPLLKLRGGLWNPNLYFEDLSGVLFFNGINADKGKTQSAYGCELHLESKIMFGINCDLGVRWTLNKENTQTIEVFFKTLI